MEEQKKYIEVLSVANSTSNGGAGRAAYRIHKGVNLVAQGVHSKMFVKDGIPQTDIATLDQFLPKGKWFVLFNWVAQKIKNKIQHAVWRPYKKTQDDSYKSDLRGMWLNGAFQKQEYDILHLHWINKRFIKIEKLPINKPIIWTLHDSWPFCGTCHYFLDCKGYQKKCGCCPQLGSTNVNDISRRVWEKKKKVFDRLDLHIVAPSRWLADCAAKSTLFGERDIYVIPNCIDVDVFSPKQKEDAIVRWLPTQEKGFEKTFILYGAVNAVTDKIKGFSNLLSALELLKKQYDCKNLEILVFGADKSFDLKINIPIHYLGYIKSDVDMALLYSLADVTVVPSLTENLSCTIMESLSCGTPVCCFDIGGNGDMVEHRVNGYLANEKDSEDLSKGIQECLAHSKEWGNAARKSILKKYSVDIVAKNYVELYKEITKR